MVEEYGLEMAEAALRNVSYETDRDLGREVTYGDSTLFNREVREQETHSVKNELRRYDSDLVKSCFLIKVRRLAELLRAS
jgi:hypothetical protein